MKSKKEIKNWILENCTNVDGITDLSNLDFEKKVVDLSDVKAISILDNYQEANLFLIQLKKRKMKFTMVIKNQNIFLIQLKEKKIILIIHAKKHSKKLLITIKNQKELVILIK